MTSIGGIGAETTTIFTPTNSLGQQEIDDTIEKHLDDGGTFEFTYRDNEYSIKKEGDEYVVYDGSGNVVDGVEVSINTEDGVDGFVKITGLYESGGEALYIGNDPSANDGEILFIEGEPDVEATSTQSELQVLMSDSDRYTVHTVESNESGASEPFSALSEGVYTVEDGEILNANDEVVGTVPEGFPEGSFRVSDSGEFERSHDDVWYEASPDTGRFIGSDLPVEVRVENAIDRYDSAGGEVEDNIITRESLVAGGMSEADAAFLEYLGGGLSEEELLDLEEDGIIEIGSNGEITLTEEGQDQAAEFREARADLALGDHTELGVDELQDEHDMSQEDAEALYELGGEDGLTRDELVALQEEGKINIDDEGKITLIEETSEAGGILDGFDLSGLEGGPFAILAVFVAMLLALLGGGGNPLDGPGGDSVIGDVMG